MKITKMNGLGSFGVWVDDFDFDSPEAWKELEQINLKTLVTVVRNNKDVWKQVQQHWWLTCRVRTSSRTYFIRKYGDHWNSPGHWDHEDRISQMNMSRVAVEDLPGGIARVTGKLDDYGHNIGMFTDTELRWHQNGSGVRTFAPCVQLYGKENMLGSSTGFGVTADWLDEQSESFRSELEDLVAIHQWIPRMIQPTGLEECEKHLRLSFSEVEPSEQPLVMTSPGGITGIHLGLGTLSGFKGMAQKEADNLIEHLTKELCDSKCTMDVWWPHDSGDLYLFDNTITMHNRSFRPGIDVKTALEKRVGIRIAGDYPSKIYWRPSEMQPWAKNRDEWWPLDNYWGQVSERSYVNAMLNAISNDVERNNMINLIRQNRPEILDFLAYSQEDLDQMLQTHLENSH